VASEIARFTVPDSELPNLKLLAHAKIEDLQAIEKALGEKKPTLDTEALSRSVAERSGLDLAQVGSIISVLWRLALIQRRLDLNTDAFLSGLSTNLSEKGSERWSTEDAKCWNDRQEYVARLISPDGTLAYGAKAAELLLDQQFLFCRARVLTDVRPVFDEGAECVQGFLPFHTLSVTYHEGGETREMHLAMDFNDIVRLRNQLLRAERKERLVRQDLTDKGLLVIQTGSESDA